MAEHQLPKLTVRVRFPSSARITRGQKNFSLPVAGRDLSRAISLADWVEAIRRGAVSVLILRWRARSR
jgi:hypothetical protein